MDLNFQQFKEFMACDDSSDSEIEDEVFIAGRCPPQLRFSRRKTEPFHPDTGVLNRRPVIPSENYFGDTSRLSSGADEMDGKDAPSDAQLDEQNDAFCEQSIASVDMRPRGNRSPIFSFQHFSSQDNSSGGNEMKARKYGGTSELPAKSAVNVSPVVENREFAVVELSVSNASFPSSFPECVTDNPVGNLPSSESQDLESMVTQSCRSAVINLPNLSACSSGSDLLLDQGITDNLLVHLSNEKTDLAVAPSPGPLNLTASPCGSDLQLEENINPVVHLSNKKLDLTVGQSPSSLNLIGSSCGDDFQLEQSINPMVHLSNEKSDLTVPPSRRFLDLTESLGGNYLEEIITGNVKDISVAINRTPTLSQQHDSAFSVFRSEDHINGDKTEGQSRASASRDSAHSPSITEDDIPLLKYHHPRTSCLSALGRLSLEFNLSVNKQLDVTSHSVTAPVENTFLRTGSPLSTLYSEVPAITSEIQLQESLGGKLQERATDKNCLNPRASDVALADVCLPSILVDHFDNCIVEDEHVDAGLQSILKQTTAKGMAQFDDSWNAPGCSGVAQLRLPSETSDSDHGNSDSDSDCAFSLEAMLRFNQHLADKDKRAKEVSIGLSSDQVQPNSPLVVYDLIALGSENRELGQKSVDKVMSSIVSYKTSAQKLPEVRQRCHTASRTSHRGLELDLQIGSGVLPPRRPSPRKSGKQATPSPSYLECLDLSIDNRIPVDRYLAVMDKENWMQGEAEKRVQEKRLTPSKPVGTGGLPMREISNSPIIGKSPECAAQKPARSAVEKLAAPKKTGIPVMEGNRHARCFFNIYSTNRLQELKAKSMKGFQHVSSPVSQYIREYPVSPFIQNIRPKLVACPKREQRTPVPAKLFFPPPTPLAQFPVARYTEKDPVPRMVEQPARKYNYFPLPKKPFVIKHTGPSHVIPDVSCLHEDESVLASGHSGSRIPQLKGVTVAGSVEDSFWQVVSPKPV